MKKLAILTSGGDGPGMNCAIRSFTRTAISKKIEVIGIKRGFQGLIDKDSIRLKKSSVGNILQRGGTILQSSRSDDFRTKEGRLSAFNYLKSLNIDGLAIVGGDGSFQGALALNNEFSFPVIGIPGTIDNDISHTDYSIGHATAVQTAIEAVDKIRDTAFSHDRVFLIEVMGRKATSLAAKVALACGAEDVLFPQNPVDYKEIANIITRGVQRGKKGSIFIVAEGPTEGRSYQVQSQLEKEFQIKSKVCILGHIQRGGSPVLKDRIISTLMAQKAVELFCSGEKAAATVFKNGIVTGAKLIDCTTKDNLKDTSLRETIKILSI